MPQTTIEKWILSGAGTKRPAQQEDQSTELDQQGAKQSKQEPQNVEEKKPRAPNGGCRADSNLALRNLSWRSMGLQPAKRSRRQLQACEWAACRQVAGFLTSGMQLDSNTQTAITGLSVSAGGTVAFVQGSGVLNIYSLEVLHRDGQELRHRVDKQWSSQGSIDFEGRSIPAPQLSSHDDEEEGETEEGGSGGSIAQVASSSRTSSSGGVRSSSYDRADASHCKRMWAGKASACMALDSLPSGGVRLDMGMRLEDVAWDPCNAARVGMVGSSSHNVTLVEIGQGTRRKSTLASRSNPMQQSGPGLSSLKFAPQGPYTLAAAGLHSPSVHLWDARRGPLAVAELVTPGKAPLQGPVEMSPDGLVLFGLAQGNQLLLWDVRKGSSSGAVLNFGATGPYHHALLAHYDLNGPLSSAMSHFLAPLEPLQQQAQEGGGGVGGLERAQQGLGVVAAEARDPLPPPPVVDQVLLDPADPSRLGLVMQNCSTAVLSLRSGSAAVTHLSLAPHMYHRPAPLQSHHRYMEMAHKRGAWNAEGTALWAPSMWLEHVPAAQAGALGGAAGQAGPTVLAAAGVVAGGVAAPVQAPTISLQGHPALAAVDCRQGRDGCGPHCLLPSLSSLPSREGASGVGRAPSSFTTAAAMAAAAAPAVGAGAGSKTSAAGVPRPIQPLSRHQVGGTAAPLRLSSCVGRWQKAHASLAQDPEDAAAQAEVAGTREAVHMAREAVYRPRAVLPVSDWVTCVAVHEMWGRGVVLAGTHGGQVLLLQ